MIMRGHDRINPILPDELILEIFRHLGSKPSRDACSVVCKRWLDLERLSRDTIRVGASNNPDALVKLLARRFVNAKNVYIDERLSISLPVQFGRRRGGDPSALSSLNLNYATEKSGSEDVEMDSYCLSDAGLTAVGEGFTKLEKLSLIWCSNVTSAGLKSIAEKCSSLRSLDLQGCYVGDHGLAAVGDCCKQVEDLNLRFCEGLTDRGLIELTIGCGKTLKSLGVAACAKITDVSLEAVGSHCRFLETLSLDSEFINNKGVLAVAKGCRLLKVLKLQCINVTDEALEAVGIFCSSLELLALYSFQRFTDKRLSELALLYCQKIGNFALSEVGRGCKHLQALHLVDCSSIGDQALHLVDCSSIGDDAICSIAAGCKNLKKLHIRRCYEGRG